MSLELVYGGYQIERLTWSIQTESNFSSEEDYCLFYASKQLISPITDDVYILVTYGDLQTSFCQAFKTKHQIQYIVIRN